MEEEYIQQLLNNYLNNQLSDEEKAILESWYNEQADKNRFDLSQKELKTNLDKIAAGLPLHKTPAIRKIWPYISAAGILIFLVCCTFYFLSQKKPSIQVSQRLLKDIAPGQKQATLRLANGKIIVLKKGLKGELGRQQGAVIKMDQSSVTYESTDVTNSSAALTYNTLTTERGEISPFPLILPDGTKIWLNAASSLTFPSDFTRSDREVTLTGEAYFEVAHNAKKPFRVKTAGQIVEDIGTRFDVCAYEDESQVRTSLIQGVVKVNQTLLKPGQQSIFQNGNITVSNTNVSQSIGWKNGMFVFDNSDLHSLMRQVARWYDVVIVYEGNPSNDTFDGQISRDASLMTLLKILRSDNLHVSLNSEGNTKQLIIKSN